MTASSSQRFGVRSLTCCLALLSAACTKSPEPPATLNIYNWAEYIAPSVIERFEKEHKVKIVYDTFDSNETLLAKLQSGFTGYDVIFPSDYMVTILVHNQLLLPLDKSKLPNSSNIDPMVLDQAYDPKNVHSVPYLCGTTGIGIRTDLVKVPIESWMDLYKPVPELQGKITMLNDRKDLLGTSLKALGFSINSVEPAQLEQARSLLLGQKPHVKVYDSTYYKNHFVSGEIAFGMAWNGDIASLYWQGNKNLKFIIPKEGGSIYCENMTIPKGAPHLELAHTFINYMMQPEIAAEITNVTYYGTPNKAALPYVREELRTDTTIFPTDETKARLEFYRDLGEGGRLHEAIYEALKAQ